MSRIALADLVGVAVAQLAQPAVDRPPAGRRPRRLRRTRRRQVGPTHIRSAVVGAAPRAGATLSTVLPWPERVDAAGVVADHAAQRAVVVRRRVRAERRAVLARAARCRSSSTMPGSTDAGLPLGVDARPAGAVLRQVETTATLHALARRGWCRRRATAPARRCRRHTATVRRHVVDVARDHDADRHLAVVRRVGASTRRGCRRRSAPRRRRRSRSSRRGRRRRPGVGSGGLQMSGSRDAVTTVPVSEP